jgi:peptidoglycan/LPS O-acetylase OafA/YrhL
VSTASADRPSRREIELDFIRGIAILLVIDFHSQYGLLNSVLRPLGVPPLGWVGVDIFFVLSGFLVGGLLIKEWKVRGRINSSSFLIRRGFKIWPQYYAFLLILLATRHRSIHELWGNLLNIQNYVGGVAHTWSLAVEEHAYLVILLLLAVAARWKLRMRTLFAVLGFLVACIVATGVYLVFRHAEVFTPTHTRLGGILAGVMLAIVYHYRPEVFHRLQRYWWLWCAAIALALAYAYVGRRSWNPACMIDLADLGGVALLMLLYRHTEGRKHNWLYRAVAWIGLYSYGIYLWHVSVDEPVMWVAQRLPESLRAIWFALSPAALGIAIGVLTTEAIEFPMLRLRERWFPRRVDSAVGTPAQQEKVQAAEPSGVGVEA